MRGGCGIKRHFLWVYAGHLWFLGVRGENSRWKIKIPAKEKIKKLKTVMGQYQWTDWNESKAETKAEKTILSLSKSNTMIAMFDVFCL